MSLDPMTADALVNAAFQALSEGDLGGAETPVAQGLAQFPTDSRLHLLAGVMANAQAQPTAALAHFWHGLAADPSSALIRQEIRHLVVQDQPPIEHIEKDFSLQSGERQTADQIPLIRADHRARYAFAAQWVRRFLVPSHHTMGLDVFCGNGYGSRMVANLAGARMVGLDGSSEAVELAECAYGTHRVVFGHAVFPFTLQAGLFDFAISFESIEHVDDAPGLLDQMVRATDGPLLISVPHEGGLPFAHFGHRFEHHVRHFTLEETLAMLASVGRTRIRAMHGQQVYCTEAGEITGLLPAHQMGLGPMKADSQFCVLVADRPE